MDKILTVNDVADILQVKDITVREMFRESRLRGFKVGKAWRTTREMLEEDIAALARGETPGAGANANKKQKGASVPPSGTRKPAAAAPEVQVPPPQELPEPGVAAAQAPPPKKEINTPSPSVPPAKEDRTRRARQTVAATGKVEEHSTPYKTEDPDDDTQQLLF